MAQGFTVGPSGESEASGPDHEGRPAFPKVGCTVAFPRACAR